MKKVFVTACAAVVLSIPSLSFAQFGLSKLMGGSSGSDGSAELTGVQQQLVIKYVKASKATLEANASFAKALGLNDEAAKAQATADALNESNISDGDKAVSDSTKLLSDKMASGAKLNDEAAKKEYANGLVRLAQGLIAYKGMTGEAQKFSSGLTTASPMAMLKLKTGASIVTSLPGNMSSLGSALSAAIDFAKGNGVEVPKDATSVL